MSDLPLVTFGFVNCNRLYYLKSCLETFLKCTEDYSNKEIIVVDNASVEKGTDEYLDDLKKRNIKVFKQEKRDTRNEYARALNTIVENSTGDFIAPLAADMQFTLSSGWLSEYVKFFMKYKEIIGCIGFDAQRKVRLGNHRLSKPQGDDFKFVAVIDKNPIMGAANSMYSREIINVMYPWDCDNDAHEGGGDSETKMLSKITAYVKERNKALVHVAPIVSPSIGIYNEKGDNARVRGDKRYGIYVKPTKNHEYYEIHDYEHLLKQSADRTVPFSIEELAKAIDWNLPMGANGNWIKNPMNINKASESDYEIIC